MKSLIQFSSVLSEKAPVNPKIVPKETGQGSQQAVGAVTETIAAGALLHHHMDPKHFNKQENQDTLKSIRDVYESSAHRLSAADLENRKNHGYEQARKIKEHMAEMYPEHEIEEVHHTAKEGGIGRATKGKHNDSSLTNPSDLTVGLRNRNTGEMIYHGISLKSTQKAKGDIGFKNPTPRHMDEALGSNSMGLWKEAHDTLNKHVEKYHKGFTDLPNTAKKEVLRKLSGNRINADRAQKIGNKPEHEKFTQEYNNIKNKTHAKIRNHIVDHLQKTIQSGEEGHQKVKDFLLRNYLNAGDEKEEGPSDKSPMPYSKVTTNGTAKTGISSKVEIPHTSKVAGVLRDPDTKLEVSRAPTGDKYIHYHAQVPEKDAKGKIKSYRRVHLFSEQVKTSSAFGNSSPRHNIQPPGKEGMQNEDVEYDDVILENNELNEKCGEGMYWCNTDKKCKPMPTEDAPTMSAGSGAIAAIGVGPQGEPGVKKRKHASFISFMKGRSPKLT